MCDSACSPLAAPSSFLLCVPLRWTGGHAELYNSSSSCRPSQLQPSWLNASSCYSVDAWGQRGMPCPRVFLGSNSISHSLCRPCSLSSCQPCSRCQGAALVWACSTDELSSIHFQAPFLWRGRGSLTIQSTRDSNRYTVSVSNINPARLTLSEAITSNIRKFQVKKPSEKFRYDYLYIVISVFLLSSSDLSILYIPSFIILS